MHDERTVWGRCVRSIAVTVPWLLLTPLAEAQGESNTTAAVSPTEAQSAVLDYFERDTFRIDTFVCPFKDSIDYEPGDIECGLLQVPENRENRHSRFIELHFIKLNSTWSDEDEDKGEDDEESFLDLAPGKRDDPIIYLTGGPGAPATYYVKRFKDHGIRKHRDLYILEQRGIGYSADFCRKYYARKPETFDVGTVAEQFVATGKAADDCVSNALLAGVDVSGYNTIENARDVRALRVALGFDQWNVWGISYGTILGQAYIKEDPQGIRAVVLDAVVPINARDDTLFWRIANWYDRDLKKLDEICRSQPGCARRYPDLGKRVRDAVLAIKDNPIVVDVKDTERFPSGKATFFPDIAGFLPFTLLYEQANYPALPGLIYAWADAIERRDETLFKALAEAGAGIFGGSQGMYDAIFCLDGYAEAQIASGTADLVEFPVLAGAIQSDESLRMQAKRCIDIGLAPRAPGQYAQVKTDIPALIVEGDMDPITPPPLAKAILPGFSNATYVEFPYAGHGPSRSVKCAGEMLNGFFDDPAATPNLRCVDEMEVPEIYTPLFTTSIAPRLLLKVAQDKKSLAVPAAWGGISAIATLVAFIVLTLSPIARFIDKRPPVEMSGARVVAWLATFSGVAAVATMGAAFAVTYDVSELVVIFGLVPWARFGALAGVVAGVLGIVVLILTVRSRRARKLPIATLTGFLLTGAATISLSVFLYYWDLGPF